ncbi:MAG: hypothetical protein ACI89U_002310 [Gammaproteobacteria bacterium]|jgi:hypothetical protein
MYFHCRSSILGGADISFYALFSVLDCRTSDDVNVGNHPEISNKCIVPDNGCFTTGV